MHLLPLPLLAQLSGLGDGGQVRPAGLLWHAGCCVRGPVGCWLGRLSPERAAPHAQQPMNRQTMAPTLQYGPGGHGDPEQPNTKPIVPCKLSSLQTPETLPEHLIGTIRLDHVDLRTAGEGTLALLLCRL